VSRGREGDKEFLKLQLIARLLQDRSQALLVVAARHAEGRDEARGRASRRRVAVERVHGRKVHHEARRVGRRVIRRDEARDGRQRGVVFHHLGGSDPVAVEAAFVAFPKGQRVLAVDRRVDPAVAPARPSMVVIRARGCAHLIVADERRLRVARGVVRVQVARRMQRVQRVIGRDSLLILMRGRSLVANGVNGD